MTRVRLRWSTSRRRLALLLAFAMVAAAMPTPVVSALSSPDHPNASKPGYSLDLTAIVPSQGSGPNGISPALARSMAVFDRQHTAADRIPVFGDLHLPREVLPASVLRAFSIDGGPTLWVAQFSDAHAHGVCILSLEGPVLTDSCGPVTRRALVEGSMNTIANRDGTTDIYGFAPGNSAKATVTFKDGSTQDAPVRGNVYGVHVDKDPAAVSWHGPNGTVSFDTATPEAGK